MAELKITADETDVIKALDNIKTGLTETGAKATDTGEKIGAAFKEADEDAKRAAKSIEEYKAAQDKLAAGAQARIAQNKLLQESLAKYRQEQQAMNKAVDEGAKKNVEAAKSVQVGTGALKENATAAASSAKNVGGLAGAAGGFLRVLGPIGLAIGAVVAGLSKFQTGLDFVGKVTASVSAIFTVLIDRLVAVGTSVIEIFKGNFQEAARIGIEALSGLPDAISNAATKAFELEGRVQALRDAQLDASVSTARLAAASEKLQATASQETKNYNDRIAALRAAISLESQIADTRVKFAAQDAAIAREQFEISSKGVADKEALIAKELFLVDTQNAADRTRIELIGQLNQLEKERTEFIKKNLEDVVKTIDKLNLALQDDPVEKELVAIRQRTTERVKAAQEAIDKLVEVEKLRPLNTAEIAQRQDLQDKIVGIIEQGNKEEIDAILEGVRKQNEIDDKRNEAAKASAEKRNDDARAALKELLDLQNQQISITEAEFDNLIAVLRAGGAKEEEIKQAQNEFDKRIKGERISAEIEYQKGLLALVGNGTEADIIRARIQELGVLLEGLAIPEPKGKGGKGGKPITIYDLLGIKFDNPEDQEAFDKAVGKIVEGLNTLAQARVDEAVAATEAAQAKVDAAQEALDKEKENLDKGLANNFDARKKDLDNAKALRDAALKEETKAKKAQIALDTVTQSVGLITSSVNIFKSLSSLGPIGIGLAVITIGTMLAAFAATKAKALKAAEPPKLRKGAKITGRTHEEGGELRELEHGEQVVGTSEAAGQDTFFENMRKGKYKGLDLAKLADNRGDYESPLSGSVSRTADLQRRRDAANGTMHYNLLSKTYEKVGQDIVAAIEKKPIAAPWKGGYKLIKETGHGTDTNVFIPAE